MTQTATIPGPAAATGLSGHPYPAAAVTDAETYWWHLGRLRESTTRTQAAGHAWSLAAAAGRIAAALPSAPGTVPDPSRDPVAWHDLSACLVRLAMALERDFTWAGCDPDDPGDGEAHREWKRLACTVTRAEFTAAWQPVSQNIETLAAPREDGTPAPLRAFAAAQVARVAAAVTGAPW
jgi:hypothetical protein